MRHRALVAAVLSVMAACGARTAPAHRDAAAEGPDAGVNHDAGLNERCLQLPPWPMERSLDVTFETEIRTADVFFLVDVTESMGGEIQRIRTELQTELIPGLLAQVPDVHFGVGHYADFNTAGRNFGEPDDTLFRVLQPMTSEVTSVQAAVDRLPLEGGRDKPEALTEALFLTSTGRGFPDYAEAGRCPTDTLGHPCFRSRGTPTIIVFTDAPTHNGPGGSAAYSEGSIIPSPHRYEETIDALGAVGARVLGIYSGGEDREGLPDLTAFARDSGAVRMDGSPLVFEIGSEGSGLAQAVVEAVRDLVDEVTLSVDLLIEDVPGDEIDATEWVTRVAAGNAVPSTGATARDDAFVDVLPGTQLTFRLVLRAPDDSAPPLASPVDLRLVLRGNGVTRLRERRLRLIPPGVAPPANCPG